MWSENQWLTPGVAQEVDFSFECIQRVGVYHHRDRRLTDHLMNKLGGLFLPCQTRSNPNRIFILKMVQ